jgi:DNA-binding Lrp family transcriptional regulator
MREILDLLKQDARLTAGDIALRLGADAEDVGARIAAAERDGVIVGYSALVNWEKSDTPKVFAFIAVGAVPEHGKGFDAVAEYISRFDEVHSVYLMSGAADLQVVVEGDDFRDIARFVAEKLALVPGVKSTATSFVLKTYKLEGKLCGEEPFSGRLVVSP